MAQADHDTKILVVDDAASMRYTVKRVLNDMGYHNVAEAADGEEAVFRMEAQQYELIICDWNMPRMNGIQLLVHARASDHYRLTPFVMLTAEGNKDNVVEAIKQGATNYILKPFTEQTLHEKLGVILKKIRK